MARMKRIALLFSLLVSAPAMAATEGGLTLGDFRVSQYSVVQASGGNSFAAWASWNPVYKLNETWGVRAAVGAGGAKASASTEDPLLIIGETAVLADYQLTPNWTLEAGPGMQYWISNKSYPFTFTLGGLYTFNEKMMGFVEGFAADYAAVTLANNLTHQFRVGLTF